MEQMLGTGGCVMLLKVVTKNLLTFLSKKVQIIGIVDWNCLTRQVLKSSLLIKEQTSSHIFLFSIKTSVDYIIFRTEFLLINFFADTLHYSKAVNCAMKKLSSTTFTKQHLTKFLSVHQVR